MLNPQRTVTIIPAKPLEERQAMRRQLRVAAYCRVSTEEEEQQSSYEAQCNYYTDKIMTNPDWTMAGIFADEGISGTSTKKRENFNRMIRRCKAKKIDLILTKSIQSLPAQLFLRLQYSEPFQSDLNGLTQPELAFLLGNGRRQIPMVGNHRLHAVKSISQRFTAQRFNDQTRQKTAQP